MQIRIVFAAFVFSFGFAACADTECKTKIALFGDKLETLASSKSSESEILLGIAEIYRISHWAPTRTRSFALDYYQRAVDGASDSKAAVTVLLRFEVLEYLNKLRDTTPEQRKEAANVWTQSVQKARGPLVIEGIALSNALAKAKAADPQNALYDYLISAILLEGNSVDTAIRLIVKTVAKKQVNTYDSVRILSRQKVLDDIEFPWSERGDLVMGDSPLVSFIDEYVISPILQKAQHFEGDDKSEAERLYHLVVEIGEQLDKTASLGADVLLSLKIQDKGLKLQLRLAAAGGDRQSKLVVAEELRKVQQRIEHVQTVLSVQRPRCIGDGEALEKYREFIEHVVKNGELQALEELGGTNGAAFSK